MPIPSGPPLEIMRQLLLEFWEVARDHRHVEASENRLLWLAIEQKTEGRLKTALGRMFAGHQPLAHFTGHGDMVTSLARSFTNDHFETERAALANAPDLDHGDLLVKNWRAGGPRIARPKGRTIRPSERHTIRTLLAAIDKSKLR